MLPIEIGPVPRKQIRAIIDQWWDRENCNPTTFLQDLRSAFLGIREFPSLGYQAKYRGRPRPYRRIVLARAPFVVDYRLQDGRIEVLAVRYSRSARPW